MYHVDEKKIEGQYSQWLVRNESLDLKAICPTESDARRIARALNLDAALGEVREVLKQFASCPGYPAAAKALRDMGVAP